MPLNKGKKNPEESYTNKYKKQCAYSYNYKLVCVDNKFSQPFKKYLGEDSIYNFFYGMIEVSTVLIL